jgi:hypothetical protein
MHFTPTKCIIKHFILKELQMSTKEINQILLEAELSDEDYSFDSEPEVSDLYQ